MSLGWQIDSAAPEISRMVDWLNAGEVLVGVEEIALRCESATYETVWVENRDGRLVISDRGETCQYLDSGDGAHRHLPLETIRQLCGEQRVELVDVPEMWPHITVPSGQRPPLAEAVAIVGRAIEHVFAAALKVPHA